MDGRDLVRQVSLLHPKTIFFISDILVYVINFHVRMTIRHASDFFLKLFLNNNNNNSTNNTNFFQ